MNLCSLERRQCICSHPGPPSLICSGSRDLTADLQMVLFQTSRRIPTHLNQNWCNVGLCVDNKIMHGVSIYIGTWRERTCQALPVLILHFILLPAWSTVSIWSPNLRMPAFTQCHLPMSCNQAPILPLAPELHPSSLCALIPAVARLQQEESNLGGFHSCAVLLCTEGCAWQRSQYAPGWNETGRSGDI